MFYSTVKRPPHDLEPGGRKSHVQMTGFVPTDKKIKAFLRAGTRLVAARNEQFDSDGTQDDDDIPLDFTRSPGVEFSDILQEGKNVGERLRSQAKAAKKGKDTPPPSNSSPEAKGAVKNGDEPPLPGITEGK